MLYKQVYSRYYSATKKMGTCIAFIAAVVVNLVVNSALKRWLRVKRLVLVLLIPGTFAPFDLHKVLYYTETFRKEIFGKCTRFPKFQKINPFENFPLYGIEGGNF